MFLSHSQKSLAISNMKSQLSKKLAQLFCWLVVGKSSMILLLKQSITPDLRLSAQQEVLKLPKWLITGKTATFIQIIWKLNEPLILDHKLTNFKGWKSFEVLREESNL